MKAATESRKPWHSKWELSETRRKPIWKMYFERAVNQYRSGIGIVLTTLEGSHIHLAIKLNFKATNKMAEC